MKGVGCILVIMLVAGCETDPYMARKDGYTPGTYRDRYKAVVKATQPDYLRNTADNRSGP